MDTTIQETEVDDMIFCNSLIDQTWDNWLDELQEDGIPQEEAEAIQHFLIPSCLCTFVYVCNTSVCFCLAKIANQPVIFCLRELNPAIHTVFH